MKRNWLKILDKLYVKQWTIGLYRGSIQDILINKTFDPEITWLPLKSIDNFSADPFLLEMEDGNLSILFEDFNFDDYYGKISLAILDQNFQEKESHILLDTNNHLSYPFCFREDGIIYVFPEAAHSGRLDCYEYDQVKKSLIFVKTILNLPILDPTILKYEGKYWMFCTLLGKYSNRQLNIFIAENLLGPYYPHPGNPLTNSPNGSRPAGNFIEYDGIIYRPSQNCEKKYGESITINKIIELSESTFIEEPYMKIDINKNRSNNMDKISIHTINAIRNIIAVDAIKWTFSPTNQWKNFLRNRKQLRLLKQNLNDPSFSFRGDF